MLRRLCNICGGVIDGEPVLDKEYADLVLVMDDDIALMYEDVCSACKIEIESLLRGIGAPKPKAEPPEPEPPAPMPKQADAPEQHAPQEPPKRAAEPIAHNRELAESVVKQYAIKLPSHQNSDEHSSQ